MRLFQIHLGLSWTRYDVISVSAARLLVAAVGCSCCKVHGNSRGESSSYGVPQENEGAGPPLKSKKSSKSENKMGSDPSSILFFEGPNPSS